MFNKLIPEAHYLTGGPDNFASYYTTKLKNPAFGIARVSTRLAAGYYLNLLS
jgi:hypothetical protein